MTEKLNEKTIFEEKTISSLNHKLLGGIFFAIIYLLVFYKYKSTSYFVAMIGLIGFIFMIILLFMVIITSPAKPFQVLKNGIRLPINYYDKNVKHIEELHLFEEISEISITKYKKRKYRLYPILSLYRWEFYTVKIYFKNKEWDLVYLRNGHLMLSTLKSAMGEDDFSKVYNGSIPIDDDGVKA